MKVICKWRDGFPSYGVPADVAVKELRLIEKAAGVLNRDTVYAAVSKDKSNPLRAIVFARSDADVVKTHRLEACSDIISAVRYVRVTHTGEPVGEPRRVFVGHKSEDENNVLDRYRSYRGIKALRTMPKEYRYALVDALIAARSFRDRFMDIAECGPVCSEIDKLLAKYQSLK